MDKYDVIENVTFQSTKERPIPMNKENESMENQDKSQPKTDSFEEKSELEEKFAQETPELQAEPKHTPETPEPTAASEQSVEVEEKFEELYSYKKIGVNAQNILKVLNEKENKIASKVLKTLLPKLFSGKDCYLSQTSEDSKLALALFLAQKNSEFSSETTESEETKQLCMIVSSDESDQLDLKKILTPFITSPEEGSERSNQEIENFLFLTLEEFLEKQENLKLNNIPIMLSYNIEKTLDSENSSKYKEILQGFSERSQKLIIDDKPNSLMKEIAYTYLSKADFSLEKINESSSSLIQQSAVLCETQNKFKVLLGLLKQEDSKPSLVFCNNKSMAQWVSTKLQNNSFKTELVNDKISQKKKISLIKKLKSKETEIIVLCDGLDDNFYISNIRTIFGFEVPDQIQAYINRLNNAERSNSSSNVVHLVCEEFAHNFDSIQKTLGQQVQKAKWFDAKLLEVVDDAENPFDGKIETGFNSPERSSSPGERYDRSRSDRGGRDSSSARFERNSRPSSRPGSRPSSSFVKSEGSSRNYNRPSEKRGSSSEGKYKKTAKHQNKGRKRGPSKKAEEPKKFGSLVKKVFSLFVGRSK